MFSGLTKLCLLTAVILCYVACNEPPEEDQGKAEQIIKAGKGGDFRGVKIGDGPDDVKQMEDAESVYSMPDELVYRIPPGEKDSTWYEISYNFNDLGLYDIRLDIYPDNDSSVRMLKNNFINYYVSRYGECQQHAGYCEWRAMTEKGHIVSITLADTVLHESRPCLQVNFNESTR